MMSFRPTAALSAALVLIAAAPLLAQKTPAEVAMQERTAYRALKASLNLTAEQRQRVHDIQKKYQPRLNEIRKKYEPQLGPLRSQAGASTGRPASPEMQKKIGAVKEKINAELAPVLKLRRQEELKVYTPAQRKLVEDFEKTHPPKK